MNFFSKTTPLHKIEADLVVLFAFEDENLEKLPVNSTFINDIVTVSKKEQFLGKTGESLVIYTRGALPTYKLIILGLGNEKDFDAHSLRNVIARATKTAMKLKAKKIAILAKEEWFRTLNTMLVGQAMVEGVSLGGYRFLKYKGKEEKEGHVKIDEVIFIVSPNKISAFDNGMQIGKVLSSATIYTRDLVNEPAMVTTPTFLAEKALELGKVSKGTVGVKVYARDEAKKMGMGAFLGVSQGSDEPPKFIVLRYKGAGVKAKIALVGKGITFDTGGLSIKSAEHMMTMKLDMAGAAAVLGVFYGLIHLKPNVEVVGVIAACENMPSGKALRPGDILKAMNGKTIEVLNTDAEGRLTLSDALSYVAKEKPKAIIDMATLTGACMVALGEEIAGLWGNDIKLTEKVTKAANLSGEKVWEMPLPKEYKDLIKSDVADLKNIQTGRYGGAITAALFLEEFVEDIPWVHLDIAGPAFFEKESNLIPKGGSGFGVRTCLQLLLDY